jgi:5-methylcytosine-specific restriction protein A
MNSEIFWQAPGNGKGFDSTLDSNSKMNSRTIGVLSFIKEYSKIDGFVNEENFKKDIKKYLEKNFFEKPNDSLDTHFYKPALFYGFIHSDSNKNLTLSIEGNLFLNHFLNKDYKECKKLIINQLDNTTYPNSATPKVKNLKLFPFRVLFKLLLELNSVESSFISKSLVHITKYEDLEEFKKSKNIRDIELFEKESSKYQKFNTWIINSLVNLEILGKKDSRICIHNSSIAHIKLLYKNLTYQDCFFENSACEVNQQISKERYKRNPQLITEAKTRDNFICQVDNTHRTFVSSGKNYVEGHHMIPMFQQKNYDFKLDDVNNIVSLCPTCHREIHYSDDKTAILDKIYSKNNSFFEQNSIDKLELYKMYSCY